MIMISVLKLKNIFTNKSKFANLIKRPKAFTLAEVLITLGIIGIVAAMTIPALIQSTHDKETVVALKKTYSTLSSAYSLAVKDEGGTPDTWNLVGMYSTQGANNYLDIMSKYISFSKKCYEDDGCWPNMTYKYLNDSLYENFDTDNTMAKAVSKDGSLFSFYVINKDCNASFNNNGTTSTNNRLNEVCGYVAVDLNGFKKPNQIGIDVFYFYLAKTGFIPIGIQDDPYSFASYCVTKPVQSFGCTAWVLYNENMDYLHCSDLSWDGKHSCK